MWSEPLVRLPGEVCFTLAETGLILSAVDDAVELASAGSGARRDALEAQDLLVGRLWPGLRALFDEVDDNEGEEG